MNNLNAGLSGVYCMKWSQVCLHSFPVSKAELLRRYANLNQTLRTFLKNKPTWSIFFADCSPKTQAKEFSPFPTFSLTSGLQTQSALKPLIRKKLWHPSSQMKNSTAKMTPGTSIRNSPTSTSTYSSTFSHALIRL